jgi:hypothetical protein
MKIKIEVEKRNLVCVKDCLKIENGLYNADWYKSHEMPVIKKGDRIALTGKFRVNYSWGHETYYIECLHGTNKIYLRVAYLETYFDDLMELRCAKLKKLEMV